MAEDKIMKFAVAGGLVGASGLAYTIDQKVVGKRLGFKKNDRTATLFLKGAFFGSILALTLGIIRKEAGYGEMFGLGAGYGVKDRISERSLTDHGVVPHVSKPLNAPDDYIWSDNGDSKYLILDPKYSL